jgi:protein SCO1/2
MCEKKRVMNRWRTLLLSIFLLTGFCAGARAEPGKVPKQLDGVGVTEKLGERVAVENLRFTDEAGHEVPLSTYFSRGKPVVLALVYYECPNLCNLLLNGLFEGLKHLGWKAGDQFELVAVSINPKETPELATKKKENYQRIYSVGQFHFLTAREDQVKALASQVGFQYRYDTELKQYMHTAVVFVLTPEGKISRYLYGISFQPNELKLSMLDASSGKIGTIAERVLLFCFHFDPNEKKYTFRIWRAVQIVLGIQVLILAGLIFYLRRGESPASNKI